MSQKSKLDNLIKKILKEELGESKLKVYTPSGDEKGMTPDQKKDVKDASAKGKSVEFEKKGVSVTEESEENVEMAADEVREAPVASEIAGKVSEIIDSLKAVSEAAKDNKHKRHAEKAMKYMEAAKTALEGLTAHESMLEEKDKAAKEKDATKDIKGIEKALGKIVKDKDTVAKMMKKMPVEKVLAIKDKMEGDIDETKVAKAMLNVALRESVQKKS